MSPRAAAVSAAVLLAGVVGLGVGLSGNGDDLGNRFVKGVLEAESSSQVTSLQFGPDGRLYVGQQDGVIRAYGLVRHGRGRYAVRTSEMIVVLQGIANHDLGGSENASLRTRLLTGLLVTGTAEAPLVYATTSDPRLGGEPELDTHSGVVSRLTRDGHGDWQRLDLVRGLPRSRETHATNGLALSRDGRTLFVAQGGMTNNGAPSQHFGFVPEEALSAAVLSVDLNGTGAVEVYASGFRNPYDVVVTRAGRLYTIDNGANAGWGNVPEGCTNAVRPGGPSEPDSLHLVAGRGYYAGHPNPARGECTHLAGRAAGALAVFKGSTNGLTEYRAGSLDGALRGDLLTVGFDNKVHRIELRSDGRVARTSVLFEKVGSTPLDVTAQGDDDRFPGTIWVGDISDGSITVFEPRREG